MILDDVTNVYQYTLGLADMLDVARQAICYSDLLFQCVTGSMPLFKAQSLITVGRQRSLVLACHDVTCDIIHSLLTHNGNSG